LVWIIFNQNLTQQKKLSNGQMHYLRPLPIHGKQQTIENQLNSRTNIPTIILAGIVIATFRISNTFACCSVSDKASWMKGIIGPRLSHTTKVKERVGLDYIQSKLDTAEKIKQWANALPKTIANPWKTTDHRKSYYQLL
jgi:hypothetical protein